MKDLGDQASPDLVSKVIEDALVGAQDSWNMQHYHRRIRTYYVEEKVLVILRVLDVLAGSEEPMGFQDLANRVRSTLPSERADSDFAKAVLRGDDEQLRSLLDPLQRDHYLRREPKTGKWQFRFPLVRRWWSMRMH